MKDIELIDLISKGNTEDLLLQKNLTRRLNILTAHGFVEIYNGKIRLTQKGLGVLRERTFQLLENNRMQREMEEFSKSTCERNSVYVYLSLVLLCTAAVFLFFLITQGI